MVDDLFVQAAQRPSVNLSEIDGFIVFSLIGSNSNVVGIIYPPLLVRIGLTNFVMYVMVTRTVVVVVMLADYLPEMQRVHLITLIIMIGIVNSPVRIHRQVFLSVCFDEIDRPTSRIDQGIVCY